MQNSITENLPITFKMDVKNEDNQTEKSEYA